MSSHGDEKKHREYWFALATVEGIGSVRIRRLLARFGSIDRIFDAELFEIARLPSFNPILAARILKVKQNFAALQAKLDALNKQDITVLFPEDAEYPVLLKSVPDAPAVLCRVGKLSDIGERCVAIVGTKQPTAAGIHVALGLAIRLAEAGFTIVSGLAYGIDTNAHHGALAGSGSTIAVLPVDFSSIYPPENRELAVKIHETGCLFSEHAFPTPPTPANLVMRNRIISGMSMATIVVETTKTGGTMHTARYARLQERPVFVCQWQSNSEYSDGARQLIKTGALAFSPDELDKVVTMLKQPESLESQTSGGAAEQMALFESE